jgi:hypothetical protein
MKFTVVQKLREAGLLTDEQRQIIVERLNPT